MSVGSDYVYDDRHSSGLLMAGMALLCACVFASLVWSQPASTLNLAYPVLTLLLGSILYVYDSALYLGYMWWIWFLTPFVRRIVDYRAETFTELSPVLLAPILVTSLTAITLLRFGGRLGQRRYFPFLLALAGILYGYIVGAVKATVPSATLGLLEWILPVLVGFHVLIHWQEYPKHRRVIRTTFVWGVLVMGTYGVIQYFFPPEWDMFWLAESGMTSSMGHPQATEFRVFSTMNSTGPFAGVMMAGLILLFDAKGMLPRLAAVPGYISFLLTLVRSAWGGWVTALGYIVVRVRNKKRARLAAVLGVGVVLSLPLLFYQPVTSRIEARAETFSNLEGDNSFRARLSLYRRASSDLLTHPVGYGIGTLGASAKLTEEGGLVTFDSGLLAIPRTLGWPGTLLYLIGLIWILRKVLRADERNTDQFAVASTGVAVALLVMLIFANHLKGHSGIIVWSFLSITLAAQLHYDRANVRLKAH